MSFTAPSRCLEQRCHTTNRLVQASQALHSGENCFLHLYWNLNTPVLVLKHLLASENHPSECCGIPPTVCWPRCWLWSSCPCHVKHLLWRQPTGNDLCRRLQCFQQTKSMSYTSEFQSHMPLTGSHSNQHVQKCFMAVRWWSTLAIKRRYHPRRSAHNGNVCYRNPTLGKSLEWYCQASMVCRWFCTGSTLHNLRSWWDLLKEVGPLYGYFPNSFKDPYSNQAWCCWICWTNVKLVDSLYRIVMTVLTTAIPIQNLLRFSR